VWAQLAVFGIDASAASTSLSGANTVIQVSVPTLGTQDVTELVQLLLDLKKSGNPADQLWFAFAQHLGQL
jgi:hypothetical protein